MSDMDFKEDFEQSPVNTAAAEAFKLAKRQAVRAHTEDLRQRANTAALNHLRSLVAEILGEIGDDNIRAALLSKPALEQWQNVFISDTFDPINNYQLYEIIGDGALKNAFLNYMTDLYPESVNAANLTRSLNYYMSFRHQVKLGRSMGLDKMILSAGPITEKMVEDVFEAFFGALQRITDNILINGERVFENEGYGMVLQLLRRVLGTVDLIIESDPIVQIKERFDVLAQPSPVVRTTYYRKPDQTIIVKMELVQNINGIPEVWDKIEGPDWESVKLRRELGERGLKIMDQRGLTKEHIQEIKDRNKQGAEEMQRQEVIFNAIVSKINQEMGRKHNSSIVGHRFQAKPQQNEFVASLILLWRSGKDGDEQPSIATIGRGKTIMEAEVDALKKFNEQHV